MIEKLCYYIGTEEDPYTNLAIEQTLLETVRPGCCILYLWQNRDTVVIGRNQNAWKECRVSALEADGGKLARRLSGGGAVYHDLGNLNFTFITGTELYDLAWNQSVISRACQMLGIRTEVSGRNDLLAEGRKFSGNAFFHHNGHSFHHGTLLVHTDLDRMQRYLIPSRLKMQAKGVDSVQSRVINLSLIRSDVTVEKLRETMLSAFQEAASIKACPITMNQKEQERIWTLSERNRAWDWNYGKELPFDLKMENRYPWGEIVIALQVCGGIIQNLTVYTDAMEAELGEQLTEILRGCRLQAKELKSRILSENIPHARDLAELIAQNL